MDAFRNKVAIAIDGGGIRGTMVAKALAVLEAEKVWGDKTCPEVFHLAAGTSTGSIISAGLAAKGLTGQELYELYMGLGPEIFKGTLRSMLWFIFRYRYPHDTLKKYLEDYIGKETTMGQVTGMDLVITAFDLEGNKTLFIKTGKDKYKDWPVIKAILASSSVPTYFPAVDDRYVDGGVGSYANPCYLAAFEACLVKKWDPNETTLISLGTGRDPHSLKPSRVKRFQAWDWLGPLLGAFLQSADDQQVRLVKTFFEKVDFRRFQVNLTKPVAMDDASPEALEALTKYGEQLADMIIKNQTDEEALASAYTLPATWFQQST
jgi:predicted acylesterase/phospholipase RssA